MTETLLKLSGIRFAHDPARPILKGVDFTLSPGERVTLVGSNGSGKTTLFQIMVGLLRPDQGRVEAFGQARLREADFHEVRARAGFLFQDSDDQLFCPTVAEDVAFGPLNLGLNRQEARAVVSQTLETLGLSGFEGRITYKLSGGEKKMVALATVLAMRPDVLLLDEPTNALDDDAEERLMEILLGLPQAMVVISNDNRVVNRLATRVVHLHDGKLTPASGDGAGR
jgi:cobalt/nickel transport system ATP-binding protein